MPVAKISSRCCIAAIVVVFAVFFALFLISDASVGFDKVYGIAFLVVYLLPYMVSIVVAHKLAPHLRLSIMFCGLTLTACCGRLFFTLCLLLIAIDSKLNPGYEENGATISMVFESMIYLAQCSVCVIFFIIGAVIDKSLRICTRTDRFPQHTQ